MGNADILRGPWAGPWAHVRCLHFQHMYRFVYICIYSCVPGLWSKWVADLNPPILSLGVQGALVKFWWTCHRTFVEPNAKPQMVHHSWKVSRCVFTHDNAPTTYQQRHNNHNSVRTTLQRCTNNVKTTYQQHSNSVPTAFQQRSRYVSLFQQEDMSS